MLCRRHLCDMNKMISGKKVNFRNIMTWVQIMALVFSVARWHSKSLNFSGSQYPHL